MEHFKLFDFVCKRCFIHLKKGLKEAVKCVDLQQSRSGTLRFLEVLFCGGFQAVKLMLSRFSLDTAVKKNKSRSLRKIEFRPVVGGGGGDWGGWVEQGRVELRDEQNVSRKSNVQVMSFSKSYLFD